jgi:SNF2 family DNA or RNA helicase
MSWTPAQITNWGPERVVTMGKGDFLLRTARDKPELSPYFHQHRKTLAKWGVYRQINPATRRFQLFWYKPLSKEEKARREASRAQSLAIDADIEIPHPERLDFHPYQRGGVAYACSRDGTLLADEMGLGKTIQAIGVINYKDNIHRVLVICPATLKLNWLHELHVWLTRPLSTAIADSKHFPSSDIVIINYDILHKFKKQIGTYWDLCIVDEVQYVKNPATRRTRHVFGHRPKKDSTETPVDPIVARRRIAISGTPVENNPMDIFPVVHWLDPVNWRNKTHFKRVAGLENVWRGGYYQSTGIGSLEHLQERLRGTCMVRRLKREVATELPPKIRQVVEISASKVLNTQALRELQEFSGNLIRVKGNVELAKCISEEAYRAALDEQRKGFSVAFEKMSEIRHQTIQAKLKACLEYTHEAIASTEEKVIVFAHHRDALEAAARHFPGCAYIHGGVTPQRRHQEIERFQKDKHCRVLVAALTISVGYNADAAGLVIFWERDWVPAKVFQAEDRAHRITTKHTVNVVHLCLEGSMDAGMANKLIEKQGIIERVLDPCGQEASEPMVPWDPPRPVSLKRLAEMADKVQQHHTNEVRRLLVEAKRNKVFEEINPVHAYILRHLSNEIHLNQRQTLLAWESMREYLGEWASAGVPELAMFCMDFQAGEPSTPDNKPGMEQPALCESLQPA